MDLTSTTELATLSGVSSLAVVDTAVVDYAVTALTLSASQPVLSSRFIGSHRRYAASRNPLIQSSEPSDDLLTLLAFMQADRPELSDVLKTHLVDALFDDPELPCIRRGGDYVHHSATSDIRSPVGHRFAS